MKGPNPTGWVDTSGWSALCCLADVGAQRGHRGAGHIVVIGSGASGILATVRLLSTSHDTRVTLVDRSPAVGGIAYRHPHPALLLNVRARALSADPHDPDDFVRWAGGVVPGSTGDSFLPRRRYGEYLLAALARHGDGRTARTCAEARAIVPSPGHETVVLGDGRRLEADAVVLALGNPPPRCLAASPTHREPAEGGVIENGLDPGALRPIGTAEPVTIVGSGLTAVDVLVALTIQGHRGPVVMVSRHGRPPLAHCSTPCPQHDSPALARLADHPEVRLAEVIAVLRAELDAATHAGRCWPSVFESLRPHSDQLWAKLPDPDRHRFLDHYRHQFERHRHRIAPSVQRSLRAELAAGRLRIVRGRLTEVRPTTCGWVVAMADGRQLPPSRWVINATGPDLRTSAFGSVAAALIGQGRAVPGWNGFGLAVDQHGRMIGADGRRQPTLWALGPVCRGARWETTAIPEIRDQADRLAAALVWSPR